jgi:hypothetical protein
MRHHGAVAHLACFWRTLYTDDMRAPGPLQSIAERVDEALQAALESRRTPIALVLGKEDYPAFQAWASARLGLKIDFGDTYRDVPVRLNAPVFLSCLELEAIPGRPNAIRL